MTHTTRYNLVNRFASMLIVLAFSSFMHTNAQGFGSAEARKLQMAEFAITHLYVDTVDEGRLVEKAIVEMLGQLDPHSIYSNAEDVKKMNEPLQGNFEGIGVQFNMVEDTLFIIQPVSNGPSERVGIMAGDRIVAVNDTAIAGVQMNTQEIMNRLRGPKDSHVELTIVRRGVDEPLKFNVKRDRIPIYSLDAAYIIQPRTGYIRIEHFGATTAEEFNKAVKDLQKQGMRDLIVDLQGNGGGYLNAAIDMANEFLEQRELIVYTEGRASQRTEFFAKGSGQFRKGRLIVLVDEYSASASEIVSGAVQDWDRGVIVGRRSFGKGLVQRPIDLPDGSMIRLTVARYYTPTGRTIQKPYESAEQYGMDLINRYNSGEMMSADSIHFPDSLKYITKKLGRTVYGGGGVMPDYFVPVDTTLFTKYHRDLRNKGVIINTTIKYIDGNRNRLMSEYRNFENFKNNYTVGDDLLSNLREAAEKASIPFNEQEYAISLPLIRTQLKALIARDLWDMGEYYQIINSVNESVQRALRILNSGEYEKILTRSNQ